jgi:hypothetical protein
MHIIQPNREILMPIGLRFGMKGFMRWQLRNKFSGKIRYDTGFFPNQILTAGRNNMYTQANWLTHCHVGTSSTPPTAGDTQLGGFVVSTSTIVSTTDGTQGAAPYFGWKRKTFRFAVGAGHGGNNLSEAGVGWAGSGSTLVSRALIIDPITQLPTTITPLTDEILDITYEMRYYPPLIDASNSVTLDGVNYDTLTRASIVTSEVWSDNIGSRIGYRSGPNYWAAYDGSIGSITTAPSGTLADISGGSLANEAYINNSYEIVMVATCGPGGWNLGSGIRCLTLWTTAGSYQTQFTSNPGGTTIPKDTNYQMIMKWTLGWDEYV